MKCDICDKDDDWEGFEDASILTPEGESEMQTIGRCSCSHEQKVML